ncbi:MAG: hypothetical protein OEV42_12525 [Deltaproteobacteria bacterium]|nr:hypothetical protein [Deltaproteobacteria bacterium]
MKRPQRGAKKAALLIFSLLTWGMPVIAAATLSGTVYLDEGLTRAGANNRIRVILNGVDTGFVNTDVNGDYTHPVSLAAGDAFLAFIDGGGFNATTVSVSDGSNLAGFDLYGDHIILRREDAGQLTIAHMDQALGAFNDPKILYDITAGNLTVDANVEIYIPPGEIFEPGGNVSAEDVKILGTFRGGANIITVEGHWDAATGLFEAGTSTLRFILDSATFTPGASSYYNVENAIANAATLTLASNLTILNDLTLSNGTLDVSAANYTVSVGGNFSNGDTFDARNGTVVLTGSGQTISGDTTFYNISKTVTSADTLYITAASTTTVTGTATLKGSAGNLLTIASSLAGSRWNFNLTATSVKDMDYTEVSDSDASGSDATKKPISPLNSVNGGNTIDWFSPYSLSGRVFLDLGITPAGAGLTIQLVVNGSARGSDVTDLNGDYLITTDLIPGDAALLYIDGGGIQGTTISLLDTVNYTDLNIYNNYITPRNDWGSGLTNTDMGTALGAYSDPDIEYSLAVTDITITPGNELFVPPGHTYAPNGNVSVDTVNISGTIAGGANTFTVALDWNAAAGTFQPGLSTVEFISSSALFTAGASSYYNIINNIGNSQTLTLGSALNILNDLTLSSGTLDVSASNFAINVGGNFSNGASFLPQNGTVTLTGSGQTLSGPMNFFNLTKTVLAADTLTFTAGATTTIDGTATLKGQAGNLLTLQSSLAGTRWNFQLNAGGAKDMAYLQVQDSDASGSGAAHIPINPANSVDGGNTIDWFPLIIVKQVWETTGSAPLPSPATVPTGSTLVFLIYVKNTFPVDVTDVRVSDVLDETAFLYIAGSLSRTSILLPPTDLATDLQIFTATDPAGSGQTLTDAVSVADAASAIDTGGLADIDNITIGAVVGQVNQTLGITSHTTFALRFRVQVK